LRTTISRVNRRTPCVLWTRIAFGRTRTEWVTARDDWKLLNVSAFGANENQRDREPTSWRTTSMLRVSSGQRWCEHTRRAVPPSGPNGLFSATLPRTDGGPQTTWHSRCTRLHAALIKTVRKRAFRVVRPPRIRLRAFVSAHARLQSRQSDDRPSDTSVVGPCGSARRRVLFFSARALESTLLRILREWYASVFLFFVRDGVVTVGGGRTAPSGMRRPSRGECQTLYARSETSDSWVFHVDVCAFQI